MVKMKTSLEAWISTFEGIEVVRVPTANLSKYQKCKKGVAKQIRN